MDTESVSGMILDDHIQVEIREGGQDWIRPEVGCSPSLNKTVRIRFNGQAHDLFASDYGTVSFLHDANCSFIDASTVTSWYNTTVVGFPNEVLNVSFIEYRGENATKIYRN